MTQALKKRIDETKATEFQKDVWRALCDIPRGKVLTYAQLAEKVGRPGAARAVGAACGANPFAPDVPCHRIVASNGGLGGYSGPGGIEGKRKLLKAEGAL